jgi:hypothetical protein
MGVKFGEGQPTDRGGRPKKAYSITQMIRDAGERIIDEATGQTRAQALAEIMWAQAEAGDRQMAQYLVDRQDGKPKERVEHSESRVLRVTLDDGTDEDTGSAEAETVHNQSG